MLRSAELEVAIVFEYRDLSQAGVRPPLRGVDCAT